jgi:hypothetical protein
LCAARFEFVAKEKRSALMLEPSTRESLLEGSAGQAPKRDRNRNVRLAAIKTFFHVLERTAAP